MRLEKQLFKCHISGKRKEELLTERRKVVVTGGCNIQNSVMKGASRNRVR